jgi:hypothetical protein
MPTVTLAKTTIRKDHGRQQPDAVARFAADAARLQRLGYTPTSKIWAAGHRGGLTELVSVLMLFPLREPDGTLTVTYTLIEDASDRPGVSPGGGT